MVRILDNETHLIYSTIYDVEMSLEFDAAPAPPPLHTSENEFMAMTLMKQHENPSWFHYPEDCYHDSLQQLPSHVLTSSAGWYVHKRDDICNKMKLIGFLLNFSGGVSSFLSCQMMYCLPIYPMSPCQKVVPGHEALLYQPIFVKHLGIRFLQLYTLLPPFQWTLFLWIV
jgi:hypothetical protein